MEHDISLVVAGFVLLYLNLRTWRDSMGVWRLPVSFLIYATMASAMVVWGFPIFVALLAFVLVDFFFCMRRMPM